MALTFIYGNSGNGKSEYIYRKTVDMAAGQPYGRFYVVVPEQFTMSTQKSLVGHSENGVIRNVDVVSFDRLAYRVFDELGVRHTVMEGDRKKPGFKADRGGERGGADRPAGQPEKNGAISEN